jgi:DNA repair protein RadC
VRSHEFPRGPLEDAVGADLSALGDVELLARVLGRQPRASSAEAESLVEAVGLVRLRSAGVGEIVERTGLARARAERLLASIELGRRVHGLIAEGPRFDGPEIVALHARELISEGREHFIVWLLNARHRMISRELVSIGSLSASIVHPREVFRPAIAAGAAALVLAHNHPSGDPEPSRDDVEITRRLVRGGHLLGIPVLDHVIVAGERYRSLRREGLVLFEWRGGEDAH